MNLLYFYLNEFNSQLPMYTPQAQVRSLFHNIIKINMLPFLSLNAK